MLQSLIRGMVDSFAPNAGRYYRELRNARAADQELRRFTPTPFGFSVSGPQYVAGDRWEIDESAVFLKYAEHSQVCIDIGANVGYYTCLAASRGKHVVAVEPLPKNLQFLYNNAMHNHLASVEVYPLGLSAKPGLMPIYGTNNLASFLPGWAESDTSRFSIVPVTTLDLIVCPRFENIPLMIKMDVEGFEIDVLSGASKTLTLNPKPVWLVEILLNDRAIPGRINQKFREVFEMFWRNGYQSRRADASEAVVSPNDVDYWIKKQAIESGPRVSNFLFVSV